MHPRADEDVRAYPGAHRPARTWRLEATGVGLAVHEWGDADAPPLLLAHGGFDFAGTYDVFAPLLAAGGWRVVSWDQRGHGDSDHAALYQWEADIRDAVAVCDAIAGRDPLPVVGHSKGGSLTSQMAGILPERVSALVNIDGVPSGRGQPDVQDHERTRMVADQLATWLEHRRAAARAQRKPGTIAELAARRAQMNPRLSMEWLEYLVTVGARHDSDGWRWKIDPSLRMGGFGPWRPSWSLARVLDIDVPFLVILGTETEPMGWGTTPEEIVGNLPPHARTVALDGVGHFVHIERPKEVADLVLAHLEAAGVAP